MFGFGKKNPALSTPVVPDEGLRIHTIPKPFYGKIVVEERKIEPSAVPVRPTHAPAGTSAMNVQPIIVPLATSVGAAPGVHAPRHEAPTSTKKKWLVIGTVVLALLLVIGGTTLYYTKGFTFGPPTAPATPQPVVVEETPPTPAEEVELVVEVPLATVVTTTITGLRLIPPYVDTIDFDTDSLTDVEEELYQSDMAVPDTDADGYHDGLEVVNLYDPKVAAPSALVSSTNAAAYINTLHGYAILHPQDWFAAAVDESTKDEVLFTSRTGEFMSLRHFALASEEAFVAWFATNATGVRFDSLIPWKNRMGFGGWYEPNGMRFYFANSNAVFVLQYEPGIRTAINFRTSLRMMAESFAFVSTSTVAPPAPLPGIQDTPASPSTDVPSSTTSAPASAISLPPTTDIPEAPSS